MQPLLYTAIICVYHAYLLSQEMSSAKITRCRHFFHSVCLRKWLYVQDRCPLCHEIIMNQDQPGDEKGEADPGERAATVLAAINTNNNNNTDHDNPDHGNNVVNVVD